MLGLPLMVAIIGGEPKRFRPLIDLYREAGRRAGHSVDKVIVGLHSIGFLGDTTKQAADGVMGTICLACHWTQNWNLEPELATEFKTLTKADCIDSNARHCLDASVSFGCEAHRVNELVLGL